MKEKIQKHLDKPLVLTKCLFSTAALWQLIKDCFLNCALLLVQPSNFFLTLENQNI